MVLDLPSAVIAHDPRKWTQPHDEGLAEVICKPFLPFLKLIWIFELKYNLHAKDNNHNIKTHLLMHQHPKIAAGLWLVQRVIKKKNKRCQRLMD